MEACVKNVLVVFHTEGKHIDVMSSLHHTIKSQYLRMLLCIYHYRSVTTLIPNSEAVSALSKNYIKWQESISDPAKNVLWKRILMAKMKP